MIALQARADNIVVAPCRFVQFFKQFLFHFISELTAGFDSCSFKTGVKIEQAPSYCDDRNTVYYQCEMDENEMGMHTRYEMNISATNEFVNKAVVSGTFSITPKDYG